MKANTATTMSTNETNPNIDHASGLRPFKNDIIYSNYNGKKMGKISNNNVPADGNLYENRVKPNVTMLIIVFIFVVPGYNIGET